MGLAEWDRKIIYLLWAAAAAFSPIGATALSPTKSFTYAPATLSRPLTESIEIDAPWYERLKFLGNRGPKAVQYLSEVLKVLDPKSVAERPGFISYERTRANILGYELRSREVVNAAVALLNLGASVRVVVDSSTMSEVLFPSDQVWAGYSAEQRNYFINAYDQDGDGQVTQRDLDRANDERRLARKLWEKLVEYKNTFGDRLELITSPREVVPVNAHFNYPRLHHLKEISIQFKRPWIKEWDAPVVSMETSANPTDSCLDRRVAGDADNMDDYINGRPFKQVAASEGHIQFGATFLGSDITEAMRGPLEDWIAAYQRGLHFDSVAAPRLQHPRVVFKDGSSLQAFFSEGLAHQAEGTIDPVWAITQILSRKDIQISTYYDGQFVYTHRAYAKHLRSILAQHPIEDLGIFVDGSQALESYSALPDLIFAPVVRPGNGVFKGKGIEDFVELPDELNWRDNVFVYRGGPNSLRRTLDKAHLKARYIEFIDALGDTHYVVSWGSANTSYNAGQLNADVSYIFESTDPRVGRMVRPFFESLRREARMQRYDLAYLERFVTDHFLYSFDLIQPKFLTRVSDYLTVGGSRTTLETWIDKLEKTGARTEQGRSILLLMKWFLKNRTPLTWSDLSLIQTATSRESVKSDNFLTDLSDRWLATLKPRQVRSAKGVLTRRWNTLRKDLPTALPPLANPRTPLERARVKIQDNCQRFLDMVEGRSAVERRRFPIAE